MDKCAAGFTLPKPGLPCAQCGATMHDMCRRVRQWHTKEELDAARLEGIKLGIEAAAETFYEDALKATAAIRALNPQSLLDQSNASEIHKREKEGG